MDILEFLTVKEFAKKLKVERDMVYKWIDVGRVKAIKLTDGKRPSWRIPFAELKRMHAQAYNEELINENN